MKRKTNILFLLPLAFLFSCTSQVEYPGLEETTQSVIQMERDALDNWSAGNPSGYSVHMAEDVTYMDDIMAMDLKVGIEEVQAYVESLEGMVGPHDYELVNPNVQQYGSVAILNFHYQPSMDGQKGNPWKATTVYNYSEGEWKLVHANWSLIKPPPQEGAEAEATHE